MAGFGEEDRNIPAAFQRFMANRAGARVAQVIAVLRDALHSA